MNWWLAHDFSNEYRQELFYLMEQKKSRDAVVSELNAIAESIDQVRAAGNFADRPLTVLTAGKPYLPDPLLTQDQLKRRDDLWINVLQAEEAHLSTRGKQIIVADSGHEIPFERPNAIVSAIRDVYKVLNPR